MLSGVACMRCWSRFRVLGHRSLMRNRFIVCTGWTRCTPARWRSASTFPAAGYGRGGEFPVRGGQRVRLQLGQCDVLGLVGVRPVQLGGYSPCVVLQYSVAEEPDPQPMDIV